MWGQQPLLNVLKMQYGCLNSCILRSSVQHIEASVAVTLTALHHQPWGAKLKI